MKKLLVLLMAFALLLCACASGGGEPTKPEEISVGNQTLSYKDSAEKFVNCGFKRFASYQELAESTPEPDKAILANEDGDVRAIFFTDKQLTSYQGISVGDNFQKVRDSFENVNETENQLHVLFNVKTGESFDPKTTSISENDWLVIQYNSINADGTISGISIYDFIFSQHRQ
ncbi:MAG: hypothetical protein IJA08_03605 [Clostridia bacterium]|nr:hypothetical protein [Clostridia bacterium]